MNRIAVIVVAVALVAGCSEPLSTREKGALIGGGIGAGTGAIVGNAVGHPGAGALIGGGVGVITGAVIGDAVQAKEKQAVAPPPPPAMAPAPRQVVVAPPPPIVVTQSPRYVWVPEWGMYVMEDQDVVYYERTHYYHHGGHWWVSQALTGPWVVVSSPPAAIARLPRGELHARSGRPGFCPPGQAKKGRC